LNEKDFTKRWIVTNTLWFIVIYDFEMDAFIFVTRLK